LEVVHPLSNTGSAGHNSGEQQAGTDPHIDWAEYLNPEPVSGPGPAPDDLTPEDLAEFASVNAQPGEASATLAELDSDAKFSFLSCASKPEGLNYDCSCEGLRHKLAFVMV
jgi:hypothetical protein